MPTQGHEDHAPAIRVVVKSVRQDVPAPSKLVEVVKHPQAHSKCWCRVVRKTLSSLNESGPVSFRQVACRTRTTAPK